MDVGLYVADGPEAAARIVKAAAPLTRSGSESEQVPQSQTSSDSGPLKATAKLITISSTPDAQRATDDALAGQVFALSKELTLIGSAEENDVIIEHDSVSGKHAKVGRDPSGGYHLTDLNSTNGVHVNGEKQTAVALEDGDIVDLGHVRMRSNLAMTLFSKSNGQPHWSVFSSSESTLYCDAKTYFKSAIAPFASTRCASTRCRERIFR